MVLNELRVWSCIEVIIIINIGNFYDKIKIIDKFVWYYVIFVFMLIRGVIVVYKLFCYLKSKIIEICEYYV